MKLKFLYPYKEMQKYYESISKTQNAWEEIMVAPYWGQIAEWAGNSCDFMKPASIKDKKNIIKQIEIYKTLDLSYFEETFNGISNSLSKDDEDPMTVAFYPSDNNMNEGVVGCCVWGNIIITINGVFQIDLSNLLNTFREKSKP